MRKFRVWRAPCGCQECAGWHWRWECTMCAPPAQGCRHGPDAWYRIMNTSLPRHMFVRCFHHRYTGSRLT